MHEHPANKRKLRKPASRAKRARIRAILLGCSLVIAVIAAWTAWLANATSNVQRELTAATALLPSLKEDIANDNATSADATVSTMRKHTGSAADISSHPLWTLATAVPIAGPNLSAVAEISRSADDVTRLGLAPLVRVLSSLNWNTLLPSSTGTDLDSLKAASPSVSAAAQTVEVSANRLDQLDTTGLVPQVAEPLEKARRQLNEVTETLNSAAIAARLLPQILGDGTPRNYLLMVQNNAETRSSGGIPGALAVLHVDEGKLTLATQSSAGDLGVVTPPIAVDTETREIYSIRSGKFMQDVNLTPDFPTAASTARRMWETKTGQQVDGVVSIDPVALSYILRATGPVELHGGGEGVLGAFNLPMQLTGENVVPTLLSDVYSKIEEPRLQDMYFASAAREIFAALSSGRSDTTRLMAEISRAVDERRISFWSASVDEQSLIDDYPVSGSITGPSVAAAQFGVYFNDGTGAKMDYYVRRTVQLIKDCPSDGYEQTTVRVTSTNTAPSDAATSLPEYVTGGGAFGVAAGTVQTNIAAYGPVQAQVESVSVDGRKTPFAPYLHSDRPVGVLAQQLQPGESKTVEFKFGKIVQHTEPALVVTPSVQPVSEVILKTEVAPCH